MLEYRTQGFCGYSVKYSPFFDSRIAVAASANFGLVGNGRVYVLGLAGDGAVVPEKWCVFDFLDYYRCVYLFFSFVHFFPFVEKGSM